MSANRVTQHEGFRRALVECGMTATECERITSAVEAAAGFPAGPSRSGSSAAPSPMSAPPDQEPCPTQSGRSEHAQRYSGFPRTTVAPSETSTLPASQLSMTAGEIMGCSGLTVDTVSIDVRARDPNDWEDEDA